MAIPQINTKEALRKSFQLFVDVSDNDSAPEWERIGVKVEDSSMELSPDTDTITDIFGDKFETVNSFDATQTFDPSTIRAGNKLQPKLIEYYRTGQFSEYSTFRLLTIYGFLGDEGAYEADVDENCTIYPTSIGGSSRVDMPISISFSGTKTLGTVNALYPSTNIRFTPYDSQE